MRGGPAFSIVRRLTALVVAVSVSALLLNGVLMILVLRPLGADLATATVRQIASARAALQQVPAEQRAALAQAMSTHGLQLRRAAGWHVMPPDEEPPMAREVRDALGPGLRFGMALPDEDSRGWRTVFEVDGEAWQLALPSEGPPVGGPLLPGLAALVLIGLAAALAAAMGVRLITRPIARIAQEMAERHDDLRPLADGPRVGVELQAVVHAFNSLVDALARARDTRRQMLAGLSHDLRTPLARLRLRMECECSASVARKMGSDFNALGRIIDQFLAYARGAGNGHNSASLGRPEPLDELLRHIALPYAAQGVTLAYADAATETAAAACSYPDLAIQRLLSNLVDNALAHGRAPVAIVLEQGPRELRLWVRDGGHGIPAESLAQALQPFVKLRAPQRPAGEAGPDALGGHSGLGLAIVVQICNQLGGQLLHQPFDGERFGLGVALPCTAFDGR